MKYMFNSFSPHTTRHTLHIADDFRKEWGDPPLTRNIHVHVRSHKDDSRNIAPTIFLRQILDALFAGGVIIRYDSEHLKSLSFIRHDEGDETGTLVCVEGER